MGLFKTRIEKLGEHIEKREWTHALRMLKKEDELEKEFRRELEELSDAIT